MRPVKRFIAVIYAPFGFKRNFRVTGGNVQLPGKAAPVAGLCQQFCYQYLIFRDGLTILAATGRPGIPSGQKTGPAGRTDRTLAEAIFKQNPILSQPVNIGGLYIRIPISSQCIQPLLVGTNPKYIWSLHQNTPFKFILTYISDEPG
jgi:hypothetical protein